MLCRGRGLLHHAVNEPHVSLKDITMSDLLQSNTCWEDGKILITEFSSLKQKRSLVTGYELGAKTQFLW